MSLLARIAGALGRPKREPEPPAARLDDVRRRLEILLAAIYGQGIAIGASTPPRARRSLFRSPPPHLRAADALATHDAEKILLPAELPGGDPAAAAARYRVMALEQAERMARGTAAYVPRAATPLERDLFLLLESAAVDRAIVHAAPGMAHALAAERAAALAARPPADVLTPAERRVEGVLARLLASDPAAPPADLAPADASADSPAESLERARRIAAEIGADASGYRGLPAVAAWGAAPVPPAGSAAAAARPVAAKSGASMAPGKPLPGMRGSSEARPDQEGAQRQAGAGKASFTTAGDVQDAGAEAASAGGGSVAAGEAPPEGEEGAGGGAEQESPERDEADLFARPPRVQAPRADGAVYHEWDFRVGGYVQRAATVREVEAPAGEGEWPAAVLRHYASTVRRLREKFERLQARRLRLSRQRDGDELDLSAVVSAMADMRAGLPVDDRLYSAVRPARRGLAIMLLVDISGSTSDEVSRGTRIIDLEKVALLLTAQALDALGDLYAVLTFSGQGAHGVRMRTVKDFDERNGDAVRQRIGALQPEGYTRLGAAVRHATARLARPEAGHRLLLIISDGKPNDTDQYNGRYGIEDSRQAIIEARQAKVFPFCLTVDRAAASYLPRIFGAAGHEILREPEHLPLALTGIVQHLLRS